jgi:hypothetical protein
MQKYDVNRFPIMLEFTEPVIKTSIAYLLIIAGLAKSITGLKPTIILQIIRNTIDIKAIRP